MGLASLAQSTARPRAARAGARPDELYAAVAADYVGLIERGTRSPVAELAQRRNVKKSAMRDMIREARERGLLTYFEQGRPGGSLTDRARAILGRNPKALRRRKRR
jgi:hypothetical protein